MNKERINRLKEQHFISEGIYKIGENKELVTIEIYRDKWDWIIQQLETLEEVRKLAKEGSEILKYGNPDNVNGYEISGVEGYQEACSEILAILNKGEK